jgi:hypothetical protein
MAWQRRAQPTNWRTIKAQVLVAHNGVCWVCGHGQADQCDHIINVARGGSHDVDNLAPNSHNTLHRVTTTTIVATNAIKQTHQRLTVTTFGWSNVWMVTTNRMVASRPTCWTPHTLGTPHIWTPHMRDTPTRDTP